MSRPVPPSFEHETTRSPLRTMPKRQPTQDDVLQYLYKIQAHFPARPGVYDTFLALITDLREERIPVVIERVIVLFANYPDLIEGFRVFLPAHYRIKDATWYTVDTSPKPSDWDPNFGTYYVALDYVNRVKWRFADQCDKYMEFLAILQAYRDNADAVDVLCNITRLFHGHDDLLQAFKRFMSCEPNAVAMP
ncbi:hypothetical protein AURDEDRAFT_114753 [Auricularia subglabra TFB-10046 SS5]|nr:hypothetical protein AURDEDRAFT_114753 [Auricularia subglabra TFB-10046 SS5]